MKEIEEDEKQKDPMFIDPKANTVKYTCYLTLSRVSISISSLSKFQWHVHRNRKKNHKISTHHK